MVRLRDRLRLKINHGVRLRVRLDLVFGVMVRHRLRFG